MKYQAFVFALFLQHSQAYKAAAVEYHPPGDCTDLLVGSEATNLFLENLKQYGKFVEKARRHGADIIVFPEYGLTTLCTDPEATSIEVRNDNKIFKKLQELASSNGIYVVVNVFEQTKQKENKTKYYNTNLVFNRRGQLIEKYRKINLYNEKKFTPGSEVVTFRTDFGVTFGIFTCFDIFFRNPAQSVLDNPEVTDIIFPTAWSSSFPFDTSLTVQHGYVLANGVNFLAANYGYPSGSLGGSGIYLASGQIAEIHISDQQQSALVISEVPRIPRRTEKTNCSPNTSFVPSKISPTSVTNYHVFREFPASYFVFKNIDLFKETKSAEVCHNEFCCTFDLLIQQPPSSHEIYKILAFDSNGTLVTLQPHIRLCSLVACETDGYHTCGVRINVTTRFRKISVTTNVEKKGTAFYTPITVTQDLRPMEDVWYCDMNAADGRSHIQFQTLRSQDGVLAFGISAQDNPTLYGLNASASRCTGWLSTVTITLYCTLLII